LFVHVLSRLGFFVTDSINTSVIIEHVNFLFSAVTKNADFPQICNIVADVAPEDSKHRDFSSCEMLFADMKTAQKGQAHQFPS
jgi:hypothetical protein